MVSPQIVVFFCENKGVKGLSSVYVSVEVPVEELLLALVKDVIQGVNCQVLILSLGKKGAEWEDLQEFIDNFFVG